MSNLLSGAVGAVVGGILALLASLIATRQQRTQARLQVSYAASGEVLLHILKIKQGMWEALNGPGADRIPSLREVHRAAERILVVHNCLIANKELRRRIKSFIDEVGEWYIKETRGESRGLAEHNQMISYMDYLKESVAAHLDDQPLPPPRSLADMQAV